MHNNRACTAAMGGSNMCGCKGGSNMAVQLQDGQRYGLYGCEGGDVAHIAVGHAMIWPIQMGER